MDDGKDIWNEIIREVQTALVTSMRFTPNNALVGGFQTTQIDLRDSILSNAAEKIINKHLSIAKREAYLISYQEPDYNKVQNETQRKIDWITKSANAVAEARERERELAVIEFITVINTYFTEHVSDEAGIRENLIGLILKATKKNTLISLEEIEKMTGH